MIRTFVGVVFLIAAAPAFGQETGFLYSGGAYSNIGGIPGTFLTQANGINNSGQIVGFSQTTGNTTQGQSFLYSAGVYTAISDPSGIYTIANGINDSSQVVGTYVNAASFSGFLFSGGNFTTIDVPGATSTAVSGINSSGQIVGLSVAGATIHGFLYSGGGFTTIAFPGAGETDARAINNSGEIVGTYYNADGSKSFGFLYNAGTYTTLSGPMGNSIVNVAGINDLGQIVGTYRDSAASADYGFIYTNGNYTILNDQSAFLSFILSTEAFGINNLGEVVGEVNLGSAVPEPSTWAMLLIGFVSVGLATRLRKRTPARSWRRPCNRTRYCSPAFL